MAYRKHTPKSRRYKKSESHSTEHKSDSNIKAQNKMESIPLLEAPEQTERKNSFLPGFLSSIFGSGDRGDHSGSRLFNIFGQDIFLDDLLLVGLIILLMTDKIDDEILLIILIYLLLDIF